MVPRLRYTGIREKKKGEETFPSTSSVAFSREEKGKGRGKTAQGRAVAAYSFNTGTEYSTRKRREELLSTYLPWLERKGEKKERSVFRSLGRRGGTLQQPDPSSS